MTAVTPADSQATPEVPAEPDSIADLRARIDALDSQIAHLLQERALVSLRVGQTKGGGDSAPIFVPNPEAEVLANFQGVQGPLDEQALASIYRAILSTSRALPPPPRVAHSCPSATLA